MRPYLAIIKDSFREAISSWVLWILLGVITLVLLVITPIGIRSTLTTNFMGGDLRNPQEFVAKLREAASNSKPSPAKRIWSLWDQPRRDRLVKFVELNLDSREERGKRNGFVEYAQGQGALFDGLKEHLARTDLYEKGIWREESLPKEARDFLAKPEPLTTDEQARLNRLLIEAALPGQFRPRAAESISLSYLGFEASDRLPFTKTQADAFIKEWVLSGMMSLLVGIIAVFVAILVTSSIIPQMFEPGSIHLLLSKPVSRTLMYLSKFIGGCAFILLNVSYLCTGLWLILGWRFGIWNQGMLLCIPIFLFVFSIYYAVSSFAGVIWKSAVVSVVVTVVFWLLCFVVGAAKVNILEPVFLDPARIVRVVNAGGTIISVNEAGALQRWNEEERDWQQFHFPSGGGGFPVTIGPLYHKPTEQLLLGQGWRAPFGMGGRRISFQVANGGQGWQLQEAQPLPAETSAILLEPQGNVIAVTSDGIFRLQGKPAPAESQMKFLGMSLPFGGSAAFRKTQVDDKLKFEEPISASVDPISGTLAVYAHGTLSVLNKDAKGNFAVASSKKLDGDDGRAAAIAIAGDLVMVSHGDGKTQFYSPKDLSLRQEAALETHSQPRFVAASPDGSRFALLFQNRRLWLADTKTAEISLAPVRGQGDISAFAFHGTQLMVADRVNRVTDYSLTDLSPGTTYAPAMTTAQRINYFVVNPLYTIFPKPGELDNTVHYLLTQKETTDAGLFRDDLEQARANLHPWRPVRSSAIFVVITLILACLYIERHEF